MTASEWVLWQLMDSAFPSGAFAHSGGIEAALQLGEIRNFEELRLLVIESIWQNGFGGLPLATAGHENPAILGELDALCDAFLSNSVANRASRLQGRLFLSASERSFDSARISELCARVREEKPHQHHAPVFGAVLGALEIGRHSMQRLFLFSGLRGVLSASVRLGILGPYQAQKTQHQLGPRLEEVLDTCGALKVSEIAQTGTLLDLFQAHQNRLYSKLFQS